MSKPELRTLSVEVERRTLTFVRHLASAPKRGPSAFPTEARKEILMTIRAHVKDRVLAPQHDVFDAIVDPERLSRFFTSSSSGRLRAGETVTWTFVDVGRVLDVDVTAVDEPDRIAFFWDASGARTEVNVTMVDDSEGRTLVEIVEEGWPKTDEGIERALGQTSGWTDFVCSMKAYIQHGVNLREGRTAEAVH
jgi:uncharacterized protein YndB with AHSA1/START domain